MDELLFSMYYHYLLKIVSNYYWVNEVYDRNEVEDDYVYSLFIDDKTVECDHCCVMYPCESVKTYL